jgi:transposase-like protein
MKARFSICWCSDGDRAAAVKLMRKLLKKQGFAPDMLVTDKLRSYGAAIAELGLSACHEQGLRGVSSSRRPIPTNYPWSLSVRFSPSALEPPPSTRNVVTTFRLNTPP